MFGRRSWLVVGMTSLLVLAGADADGPTTPKSPKASYAIRVDNAAIRKASVAYWAACSAADKKLENELKTAVDAAHARNDGTEEKACLEAVKDVQARLSTESAGYVEAQSPAPIKPLRCETRPS